MAYVCKRLFWFGAAASPAHLPAPPSTDGDIIMLTEEPPVATVAVVPDQAATSVNVSVPEGVSPVPDQAATPALPDPSSVAHQAPMPDRPAEGRSLATAAMEETWLGVDPDARLEELSVADSAVEGMSCASCWLVIMLAASLGPTLAHQSVKGA